jgi:glycosyltransferase involved in cell wall biosynthesis
MPTYQQETYIAEAIQSVLAQTYKLWDLYIVNDGCTDDTQRVIDYYVKKDKRIKCLINKTNKGMAFSRNRGIQASKGDYIACIDSDDISNPDRLKKSLKPLEKYDFIYTNYHMGNEQLKIAYSYVAPDKLTLDDIIKNSTIPHETVIAHRKCFIDNPYPDRLRVNEDGYTWFSWYKAGYTYKKLDYASIIVRSHPDQSSKTRIKEVNKIGKELENEIKEYQKTI